MWTHSGSGGLRYWGTVDIPATEADSVKVLKGGIGGGVDVTIEGDGLGSEFFFQAFLHGQLDDVVIVILWLNASRRREEVLEWIRQFSSDGTY